MKAMLAVLMMAFSPLVSAAPMELGGFLRPIIHITLAALIFWAVWWFIDYSKIPEPFNKILLVLVGLAALVFVVNILSGMMGAPLFS